MRYVIDEWIKEENSGKQQGFLVSMHKSEPHSIKRQQGEH